jgi:hypothetical protein
MATEIAMTPIAMPMAMSVASVSFLWMAGSRDHKSL